MHEYARASCFKPRHAIVAGYCGIALAVRMSVHPSVVRLVNVNGFLLNSVCALISWRSGLGLLMGKFRLF